MKRLEKQLKALQDHLTKLGARADKARGQTRRRLKRFERRTRVTVERTVRVLEPKVRQAVAEAAVIASGVRAGVQRRARGCPGGGRCLPPRSAKALTLPLLLSRAFGHGFRARRFRNFTDRGTSGSGLSWTALTVGPGPPGCLAQPPDREAPARRARRGGRHPEAADLGACSDGGGVHRSDRPSQMALGDLACRGSAGSV